ncbi:MAG: hypothetical protein ABSC91_09665 [Candidatus Bathyarchaeia archaeon]|jgi:hypothetical protein
MIDQSSKSKHFALDFPALHNSWKRLLDFTDFTDQIGVSAAFEGFADSIVPAALFAAAEGIGKSYVLPMANAMYNAWIAAGYTAVFYTQLNLLVSIWRHPFQQTLSI